MTGSTGGEPDIAATAALFADTRRARVLMALADGRALPAGRLAQEAGVAASTISNHLALLLGHGLVSVVKQGRHRYYRLADPQVETVIEALAGIAPQKPITSLREHTKAHALRTGRTCYGHLAGKAGVELFAAMIEHGWVAGGDGRHDPRSTVDSLSAGGKGNQYRLTGEGAAALDAHAIPPERLTTTRPLRYCVDWSEQDHHLAGPLGRAITDRLFELGAITRATVPRSVTLTDAATSLFDVLAKATQQ